MERRYILFIALSLAIVFGSQVLQATFFPRPPEPAAEPAAGEQVDMGNEGQPAADAAAADVAVADAASGGDADAVAGEALSDATVSEAAPDGDAADPPAERTRWTLGSLDAENPVGMLVTLTSRGAAVERIELAGKRFHDQDDRSGYLGHLALETVADGCRVRLVGPGTPAAVAGLAAGDVIVRAAEAATADVRGLTDVLNQTKPGEEIQLEILRDGNPQTLTATLSWRPLEVVRPERLGKPASDPDGEPTDPM